MRRTSLRLAAAAAAGALLLAGCSSGGGEGGSTDDAGASGFSFAIGEPDFLTPGRQTVAFEVVTSIFAPLVDLSDDGEIEYLAAESVTSDDAVTWTVTLRDGWTFHDGTPVTAQSYVDAWNTAAYGPNAWAWTGSFANVVGYADVAPAEGEPTAETMSGLRVVDDLTFEVELASPDSQFPLQLTAGSTAFYPMPEAAFEDLEAYDDQPIGNGPFRLTEPWAPNEPIVVEAYEDYAGPEPGVETIQFTQYSDLGTAYTDVQAGTTDIVFVEASRIAQVEQDFGDRVHAYEAPGQSFLGFPLDDPRYADPRVRQAISLAIDRDAIDEAIYGGFNAPLTALTAPVLPGAPTDLCEHCRFDPEEGQALLAEAGGWEGPMEIWYPGGLGVDELYTAVANQIRQNLGIEEVVPTPTTDWAAWYDALTTGKVTGPHFARWGALYPSMQDPLRALFTAAGGCQPCTTYSEPEVEELLAQADAATDEEESHRLYVAAQERILEDFPVVPMFSESYVYAFSERIAGAEAQSGSLRLASVTVHE